MDKMLEYLVFKPSDTNFEKPLGNITAIDFNTACELASEQFPRLKGLVLQRQYKYNFTLFRDIKKDEEIGRILNETWDNANAIARAKYLPKYPNVVLFRENNRRKSSN